jgi:hypothetical protein
MIKLRVVDEGHNSHTNPDDLHKILKPTQVHEITFSSEKRLHSYRLMIYSINKQGKYRYRTMRAEDHAYALVIWRMK